MTGVLKMLLTQQVKDAKVCVHVILPVFSALENLVSVPQSQLARILTFELHVS